MASELENEGHFQLRCKDYTLAEFDSGAVSLNMQCRVLAAWDEESKTWADWVKGPDGTEYDEVTVEGNINLIKKKNADGSPGALNEKQIDALIEHCGWDANMASLANKECKPADFQGTVKKEEYKGKVSYKLSWINALNGQPGGNGLNAIASEAAQRLQDQFGPSLRALAGKAKDKQQKPGGKPTLPPKPKAPPVGAANASHESIPF